MEYKSRSLRLAEDVWDALQAHELSANQLLREALGLPFARARNVGEKAMDKFDKENPHIAARLKSEPRKQSKKEQVVAELAASDLTAQLVERDDSVIKTVDHIPPDLRDGEPVTTGITVIPTSTLRDWRAGRKPLPKPGEKTR